LQKHILSSSEFAGFPNSVFVLIDPLSKSKLSPYGTLLNRLRESLNPFVINPAIYGLHSFRSGRATTAANAKAPRDLIALHGREKRNMESALC